MCPAEEGVGCFGEVYAVAALQGLARCEDGALFWRGDLGEDGVFTNVASCLEIADGLHAEAGCFVELGEDCRAFFMHDVVHAGVVDVAGCEMHGLAHVVFAHEGEDVVEAAEVGACVVAKLKEIAGSPMQELVAPGEKAADEVSLWQGVQHGAVAANVLCGEGIQHDNDVDVALCGRFSSRAAALQPDEPQPPGKGLGEGALKILHPCIDVQHISASVLIFDGGLL